MTTETQTLANANGAPVVLEHITKLTAQGMNDAQIADELGLGLGQVRRIAKRGGVTLNKIVPVGGAAAPQSTLETAPPVKPEILVPGSPQITKPRRAYTRKPKPEVVVGSDLSFSVDGHDDTTLKNLGSILLFAERNKMTVESFVTRCRWVVQCWDGAMKESHDKADIG